MERRTRTEEVLRILNTLCLFLTLFTCGLLLNGPLTVYDMEGAAQIAALVLLYEIFARHFRRLWLFTLVHAGTLAVLWELIPQGGRPWRMILSAFILMLAYRRRLSGGGTLYPGIWLFIVYAIIYFVGMQTDRPPVCQVSLGAQIMTVFLYLFYMSDRALHRTEKELNYFVEVPGEKSVFTNAVRVFPWAAAAAVLIAVSVMWGPGSRLFEWIREGALLILRVLFRAAMWFWNAIAEMLDISISDKFLNGDAEMDLPFTGTGNPFLDRLWDILSTVLLIACAGLLIYGAYRAARWFMRKFRQSVPENSREVAERIAPKERQNRAHGKDFPRPYAWFTPRRAVRREYRNFLIGSGMSDQFSDSDTPRELENISYSQFSQSRVQLTLNPRGTRGMASAGEYLNNENADTDNSAESPMEEIHEIYERARYSSERISMRDTSAIRSAIRQFHRKGR